MQRATGALAPRPRPGGQPEIGPERYPHLQAQLRAAPEATLAQHCTIWAETEGQVVSVATMWRTTQRLGWTYKKTLGAAERDEVARQAQRAEVAAWSPEDVVVLDEAGTNVALTPQYARAPRNERAHDVAPFNKGGNITTLATLTTAGSAAAMTVSGAADTLVVEAFVREYVVPHLRAGQILVLDNVWTHKSAELRRLVAAAGCRLRFLPPYSPDLAPIEEAFSKFKALRRRANARTVAAVESAIGVALDAITPRDARQHFRHCGYGTAT